MNNELERMWQEAVVNCSEVVSRYFPCRTEENHLNFGEGNRGLNLKILKWKAGLLPAGTRLLIVATVSGVKRHFVNVWITVEYFSKTVYNDPNGSWQICEWRTHHFNCADGQPTRRGWRGYISWEFHRVRSVLRYCTSSSGTSKLINKSSQ
jgi:hypothetical protein